jgi:hypothetical protein
MKLFKSLDKIDEVMANLLMFCVVIHETVFLITALKQESVEALNEKLSEIFSFKCWTEEQNLTLKKTVKYCNILMTNVPRALAVPIIIALILVIPPAVSTRQFNWL